MRTLVIFVTVLLVLCSAKEHNEYIHLLPRVTPNPQNAPLRTLLPEPKPRVRAPISGTTTVANCGISSASFKPNSRIVNGQEAVPHSYPWQVALYIDNFFFCGGTLISDEWVLTAGHCTTGSRSIRVVMGAHNLTQNEATQVKMTSTNITTNQYYSSALLKNDVGLVHLPQAVSLTSAINPICLPAYSDSEIEASVLLTASGWGATSGESLAPISDTLNEVANPSISNAECYNSYGIAITDDTICTDTSTGDKGICGGDDGGPLMLTVGGKVYSRGVSSFVATAGCKSDFPNGFMRTHRYLDWIESITGIAIDP